MCGGQWRRRRRGGGHSRERGRECKGEEWVAHVSVDSVCECVCFWLFISCVCFDTSVSYRAAVGLCERGDKEENIEGLHNNSIPTAE